MKKLFAITALILFFAINCFAANDHRGVFLQEKDGTNRKFIVKIRTDGGTVDSNSPTWYPEFDSSAAGWAFDPNTKIISALDANSIIDLGGQYVDDDSISAGYLSKASDSNTIEDSIAFESSGKIGLNTADPNAVLDIYSEIAAGTLLRAYGDLNHTADLINAGIGSTEKFVVEADGDVGICGAATAQLTQTKTCTIQAGELINQHLLTFNVKGVSDDAVVQGTRTLGINTHLSGDYDMGTISGAYINTYNDSNTVSLTSHQIGILGQTFLTGTGTVSESYGVYGRSNISDGVIGNAYGIFSSSPQITGGAITNYFGFGNDTINCASSTVTNAYGAFFPIPSGATNNNIGLIVGGAPGGSNSLAAYFDGAIKTNSTLDVDGLANLPGGIYLNAGNISTSGKIQIKNKAGDGWLAFATRNTAAAEAVYDLAYVGTVNSGAITSGLINEQTISSAANFTGTMAIAGNVSIGTTGSTKLLTVHSNDNSVQSVLALNNDNISSNWDAGIKLEIGDISSNSDGYIGYANINAEQLSHLDIANMRSDGNAGGIRFMAGGGVERVRITSAGNVGIRGTLSTKTTVTTDNTNSAATHTAAEMMGGLIRRGTGDEITSNVTDVTDTAANIVAAIPGCVVESSYEFSIRNEDSTHTIALDGGTWVTIVPNDPSTAIPSLNVGRFKIVVTNATVSSEAVNVECLGYYSY